MLGSYLSLSILHLITIHVIGDAAPQRSIVVDLREREVKKDVWKDEKGMFFLSFEEEGLRSLKVMTSREVVGVCSKQVCD